MIDTRSHAVERSLPIGTPSPDWTSPVLGARTRSWSTSTRRQGRRGTRFHCQGQFQLPIATIGGLPGGLSQDGRWLVLVYFDDGGTGLPTGVAPAARGHVLQEPDAPIRPGWRLSVRRRQQRRPAHLPDRIPDRAAATGCASSTSAAEGWTPASSSTRATAMPRWRACAFRACHRPTASGSTASTSASTRAPSSTRSTSKATLQSASTCRVTVTRRASQGSTGLWR